MERGPASKIEGTAHLLQKRWCIERYVTVDMWKVVSIQKCHSVDWGIYVQLSIYNGLQDRFKGSKESHFRDCLTHVPEPPWVIRLKLVQSGRRECRKDMCDQ